MDSALTLVGLPIALGIIMLGLGLGLTVADFRRVAQHPKAAVIALACQVLLLPALCFGLVLAFDLPPELAVGMMLLAASPGGTTANLYSHLFGGHVALNITLTAINSVLAVLTLPIVVNLSAGYFLSDATSIGLQFDKVVQVFAIVLVPVAIGMLVRARVPGVADRLDRPVRIMSVVVLVAVILGAVLGERENIADYFVAVGLAVLAFNLLSLAVGYGVPRLAGIDRTAAKAAGFEIGIHNSTLAITIALSPALLNNTQMAIPAAVYGIVMFFTAAAFGYLVNRLDAGPRSTRDSAATT
ncbi:bile acid:sodium symporter family protein [Micromonospora craniellae]|uniref:Bile acid:sodium symporter family protein n=1 Tax=Micromonospora craniellae TaxID=2294034 RepID=A0A372G2F1_9ACTN|nr:bile acid:sodium symporter family protein [Micromonospora craniellae]QOC92813.1 bile acid:sodium symporter family protein [Micromonospora craniellae]RFS46956.1 bile acid:sodium symporter family protein [Micromonospora craniellae]